MINGCVSATITKYDIIQGRDSQKHVNFFFILHEKSESGGKSKIHKNNGRNPGVFLPPLFLPPLSDFL